MTNTDNLYRLVGWDPTQPGSIRWLADDGYTLTRDPARALTVAGYRNADARAIACAADEIAGFNRWRPVAASIVDLTELQSHTRSERQPLGPTPGTPTPARRSGPSALPGFLR